MQTNPRLERLQSFVNSTKALWSGWTIKDAAESKCQRKIFIVTNTTALRGRAFNWWLQRSKQKHALMRAAHPRVKPCEHYFTKTHAERNINTENSLSVAKKATTTRGFPCMFDKTVGSTRVQRQVEPAAAASRVSATPVVRIRTSMHSRSRPRTQRRSSTLILSLPKLRKRQEAKEARICQAPAPLPEAPQTKIHRAGSRTGWTRRKTMLLMSTVASSSNESKLGCSGLQDDLVLRGAALPRSTSECQAILRC
eukprot:6186905-Pleurochrysis_carterae.AAC.2